MSDFSSTSIADALNAAQDWWRDAGVDCDFEDEPRNWLVEPKAEIAQPAPAIRKSVAEDAPALKIKIGGDAQSWPTDLTEFDKWWLAEPSLAMGSNIPRPAPRGAANAPLMVLVPQPEAEDREALLSGPQGAMIGNMLRAMGLSRDQVRLASVLPRHTPAADWQAMADVGFGALTLHHLALAAPKRLLVLGRTILPLLGADPERAAALTSITAKTTTIEAIAGREPATLLAMAPARRALWHRWLERSSDD